MTDVVSIDGSMGEGGGQVLRTSLALALATGRTLRMHDIRANRSRPGLRRQHVTAVEAAQAVGHAYVEGAEVGSRTLHFEPQGCHAGTYHLNVGTAGSTTLVAQTVLPVLLFRGAPSTLVIEGGTHTHFAPPFEYLPDVYLPLLARMGARVEAHLERTGFFPKGGGRIRIEVGAADAPEPLSLLERGRHVRTDARAVLAHLPAHVAERELTVVQKRLGASRADLVVDEREEAACPGNALLIRVAHEHVTELFTAYGKQGVPAERVAAAASREAKRWSREAAPVGPHLADQLMLPLALGAGGAYRAGALSRHSETNLEVLRRFLGRPIAAEQAEEGVVEVRIG